MRGYFKRSIIFSWEWVQQNNIVASRLPVECSKELSYGWWLKQREFDLVFDNRQGFIPLINLGWLEKISTSTVKKFYSKRGIYETLSKKKARLL